jgi:hypothetical protein
LPQEAHDGNMPSSMRMIAFKAKVSLLSGRPGPILTGYCPGWDLGDIQSDGVPVVHGGRVYLDGCGEIAPGAEGFARIEPLAPELWSSVSEGTVLPMREGPRVVGHATILQIIADET